MKPVRGIIKLIIDGKEEMVFENEFLNTGRNYLAKSFLKEEVKLPHITNMVFGDGGTEKGKKKTVKPDAKDLYGTTRINKTVIPQIDETYPNQVLITTEINKDEGNDYVLN